MDFLTKVKEAVMGVTKTAVSKSNELVEVTKLKIAVRDAENEVEKCFREIGEAVYNASKNESDPSDTITSNCEKINEKYEEIAVMREKLLEFKNVAICPSCGCEVPNDSEFCKKCGKKI